MVLMAAAVVSMMFFQAWSYMGPRISQWLSGNAGGPVMGTMQDKPVHSQEVQDFYTRVLVAGRFWERSWRSCDRAQTAPKPAWPCIGSP